MLALIGISGGLPQHSAMGTNAGLPGNWDDVSKQMQGLCDQARKQPVLLLWVPQCAAGHEQCARVLVVGRDANRDKRACATGYRRAFNEQLNGCMARTAIVAEPMANTDQVVPIAASEAFGSVLVRRIGLRDA